MEILNKFFKELLVKFLEKSLWGISWRNPERTLGGNPGRVSGLFFTGITERFLGVKVKEIFEDLLGYFWRNLGKNSWRCPWNDFWGNF